jgi:hypothetical protein
MNGCSADPAGARPILMPIWTISDVTPAQLLKKPAKIGPNFTRIETGKNRALTMPNIRPDLIRI